MRPAHRRDEQHVSETEENLIREIRVTRPKIFHFLETNLKMATGVHEHVHVIGFLIWLGLGCAVKFVAKKKQQDHHEFHEFPRKTIAHPQIRHQ